MQPVRRGHLAVQAGHLQEPPGEHRSWLWLSETDGASTCLAAVLYNGKKLLDTMTDYTSVLMSIVAAVLLRGPDIQPTGIHLVSEESAAFSLPVQRIFGSTSRVLSMLINA